MVCGRNRSARGAVWVAGCRAMIFIWLVKGVIGLISEKQYARNWPECHPLIARQGGPQTLRIFLRQ
jgi:hypothetical protein